MRAQSSAGHPPGLGPLESDAAARSACSHHIGTRTAGARPRQSLCVQLEAKSSRRVAFETHLILPLAAKSLHGSVSREQPCDAARPRTALSGVGIPIILFRKRA